MTEGAAALRGIGGRSEIPPEKSSEKVLTSNRIHAMIVHVAGKSFLPERRDGSIAQLGEHLPYKQRVTGSSPVVSTIDGAVVQSG